MAEPKDQGTSWAVLSNHGHALIYLATEPDLRLVDLAEHLGVRERSAHRIVSELVAAGYVQRERYGRRVRYTVDRRKPLRRPDFKDTSIGDLVDLLQSRRASDPAMRPTTSPPGEAPRHAGS